MVSGSQTTAYAHNTRPRLSGRFSRPSARTLVDRLKQRDYSFHPSSFSDSGVLFRAIVPFTPGVLSENTVPYNPGKHSLFALERELGALLFSNELSDAISLARLDRRGCNAAIAVFSVSSFHARARRAAAGVLAFAEPGFVFRYPFLAPPFAAAEAQVILVHRDMLRRLRCRAAFRALALTHRGNYSIVAIAGRVVVVLGVTSDSRAALEADVTKILDRINLVPAQYVDD